MKLFFILVFTILTTSSRAQTIEVDYDQYRSVDYSTKIFKKKKDPWRAKMFFNDSLAIVYHYYEGKDYVSENQKRVGDTLYHHGTFYDYKEKDIFYGSHNFKDQIFLIKGDTATLPTWTITENHKMILGYACTSAEIIVDNRHKKVAWFTTEMKYKRGSFFSENLPGVVLEVIDEQFGVHFKARNVRARNIIVVQPSVGLVISSKGFSEMMREAKKNSEAKTIE